MRLALLVIPALLGGCLAGPVAPATSKDVKVNLGDYADPRNVQVVVKGPGALATGETIMSTAPASFRVSAASEGFKPVVRARVRVRMLDGTEVGRKTFTTNESGLTEYNNIPDGKPLSIHAAFDVNGKTYELATLIAPGKPTGPLTIDPVSTLIDAKVKKISNRTVNLLSVNQAGLARTYAILDGAGVSVDLQTLESGRDLEAMDAIWTRETAKVTAEADKKDLASFLEAIEKDAASVRNPQDKPAS